jgi:hypothetical protein
MNDNGLMDRGPAVNGKKFLIAVIGGLVVFTLIMMFVEFGIGNYFGHVMSKKAMEHDRTIETQIMRNKESNHQH